MKNTHQNRSEEATVEGLVAVIAARLAKDEIKAAPEQIRGAASLGALCSELYGAQTATDLIHPPTYGEIMIVTDLEERYNFSIGILEDEGERFAQMSLQDACNYINEKQKMQ